MKKSNFILALIVATCSLSLSSCFSSKLIGEMDTEKLLGKQGMQKVKVITDPEGANVLAAENNNMLGISPTEIYVSTKKDVGFPLFKVTKDGYKTYTYKYQGYIPESKEIKIRLTPADNQQRVNRDNAGKTDMEKSIIRWNIDSDPRGARVFYRVISSIPDEVKNTNETYLGTTPYEETRSFNIIGLTYENANDVTIEIKLTRRGYEDQIKRFNARMALDQQEISGFFELVEK